MKIRIMPESLKSNLNLIEKKAKSIVIEEKGRIVKVNIEPVAFGLKAIIIQLTRREDLDQDPLMDKLQAIENISSAEIIDVRRLSL